MLITLITGPLSMALRKIKDAAVPQTPINKADRIPAIFPSKLKFLLLARMNTVVKIAPIVS